MILAEKAPKAKRRPETVEVRSTRQYLYEIYKTILVPGEMGRKKRTEELTFAIKSLHLHVALQLHG